jgi:hypothetical protein
VTEKNPYEERLKSAESYLEEMKAHLGTFGCDAVADCSHSEGLVGLVGFGLEMVSMLRSGIHGAWINPVDQVEALAKAIGR